MNNNNNIEKKKLRKQLAEKLKKEKEKKVIEKNDKQLKKLFDGLSLEQKNYAKVSNHIKENPDSELKKEAKVIIGEKQEHYEFDFKFFEKIHNIKDVRRFILSYGNETDINSNPIFNTEFESDLELVITIHDMPLLYHYWMCPPIMPFMLKTTHPKYMTTMDILYEFEKYLKYVPKTNVFSITQEFSEKANEIFSKLASEGNMGKFEKRILKKDEDRFLEKVLLNHEELFSLKQGAKDDYGQNIRNLQAGFKVRNFFDSVSRIVSESVFNFYGIHGDDRKKYIEYWLDELNEKRNQIFVSIRNNSSEFLESLETGTDIGYNNLCAFYEESIKEYEFFLIIEYSSCVGNIMLNCINLKNSQDVVDDKKEMEEFMQSILHYDINVYESELDRDQKKGILLEDGLNILPHNLNRNLNLQRGLNFLLKNYRNDPTRMEDIEILIEVYKIGTFDFLKHFARLTLLNDTFINIEMAYKSEIAKKNRLLYDKDDPMKIEQNIMVNINNLIGKDDINPDIPLLEDCAY